MSNGLAGAGRRYGVVGRPILMLLHGGPGAPGHLGAVGQRMADEFRVIEPFERRAGREPLTVNHHVDDFVQFLRSESGDSRAIVLGFSSGAIHALAFAAKYPESAIAVVLVSSATMDHTTRTEFKARLSARLNESTRKELASLGDVTDPDERLGAQSRAVMPSYFVDAITMETGDLWCDGRGHDETWHDMLRLQETGVHPAAFARIRVPVLMVHGTDDPHPGPSIRGSLQPYIPHIEYVSLQESGHYPWLERAARESFFDALRKWLRNVVGQTGGTEAIA